MLQITMTIAKIELSHAIVNCELKKYMCVCVYVAKSARVLDFTVDTRSNWIRCRVLIEAAN